MYVCLCACMCAYLLHHQSTTPNETCTVHASYTMDTFSQKIIGLPDHTSSCGRVSLKYQKWYLNPWTRHSKFVIHTYHDSGSDFGWVPPGHTSSSGSVRVKMQAKKNYLDMGWVAFGHTSSCGHVIPGNDGYGWVKIYYYSKNKCSTYIHIYICKVNYKNRLFWKNQHKGISVLNSWPPIYQCRNFSKHFVLRKENN